MNETQNEQKAEKCPVCGSETKTEVVTWTGRELTRCTNTRCKKRIAVKYAESEVKRNDSSAT